MYTNLKPYIVGKVVFKISVYTMFSIHLLYKAEKPSVCPSSVFGAQITQQGLHRLKQDLLKMKAVSFKKTNFILTYRTHRSSTGVHER